MDPCSWKPKRNSFEHYGALLSLSTWTGAEAAFSCSQCQDLLALCCPLTVVWGWRMERCVQGWPVVLAQKLFTKTVTAVSLRAVTCLLRRGRVQRAGWWEVPETCLRMSLSWVLKWAASVSLSHLGSVAASLEEPGIIQEPPSLCLQALTWSSREATLCMGNLVQIWCK